MEGGAVVMLVPYAAGAASPTEIARASVPFGGAVFVIDEGDPTAAAHRPALAACGRVCSWSDGVPGVVAALGDSRPDGIVTFADTTIAMTSDLAEAFGLRYHSRVTARLVADKLAQRRRLNEAGLSDVAVVPVRLGPDAAPPDPGHFPLVVKPVAGSGSEQTVVVAGPEQYQACTSTLDPTREYVAEGFLGDGAAPDDWLGNYLSVESELAEGASRHHGVTGRLPLADPARESGALFPLDLDADTTAALHTTAEGAAAALGITSGFVHTEIKLTPSGPQVIEVNGRLGGRLTRLMQMVGRREPLAAAISTAAGRPVEPLGPTRGVALSFWLQPPVEATRVEAVPAMRELAALPGVVGVKQLRGPGDPVDWRRGTASYVLEAWLHAPTRVDLREHFLNLQDRLGMAVRYA